MSYKELKKEAWALMSKYVRSLSQVCYTCGSTVDLQAGHFMHNRLDYDTRNVKTQCKHCNQHLSGNPKVFERKLREELGDSYDDFVLYANTKFYTNFEIEKIIQDLKEKLQK